VRGLVSPAGRWPEATQRGWPCGVPGLSAGYLFVLVASAGAEG